MLPNLTVNSWFALVRASHFTSCLVLLGVLFFDRMIASSFNLASLAGAARTWQRIFKVLVLILLPAALITGRLWLGLTCIAMTGLPSREALTDENLAIIWNQTHFGTVWKWRLAFWMLTTLPAGLLLFGRAGSRSRDALVWLALACASALAASLAWAGHAMLSESGWWHVIADVLHILVCGVWPAMLVPFLLVLWRLKRFVDSEHLTCLAQMTRRFSTTSLLAVVMLTVSGLVNSWFLLGPISNLINTTYGKVLLFKVASFTCMVGMGAVNLLYLRPRLCANLEQHSIASRAQAMRRMQLNVGAEIVLAAAVVYAVGYLGLTAPPIHPGL